MTYSQVNLFNKTDLWHEVIKLALHMILLANPFTYSENLCSLIWTTARGRYVKNLSLLPKN